MESLQSILDGGTAPFLTAFLLGLLTAISPCPLATNIAAIGFIGRDIESRRVVFRNGLLYTLGRIMAYTVLSVILIAVLKEGASIFGIQKFMARYGEIAVGPALLLIDLLMLFGDRLNFPSFGFKGGGERWTRHGGWGALLLGVLFALAFCPTSGMFYFGILVPMSATATAGYLFPVLFAVATALLVLIVAWVLAFSAHRIGEVYGKMQTIRKWMNVVVGIMFFVIGVYYCVNILF